MKKQILLYILTLGMVTSSYTQEYGWKDISANIPTATDLSDVFFVSDNEGWITSSSHAEIYHTIDGGVTFEIHATQLSTNAIHMLNATEGYSGGESGFIYRTTDGGANWNFHGTLGATLSDISFAPSGGTGYACGDDGAISSINTTAITPMYSGVPDHLASICFPLSSEEGWVCGGSIILHYINGNWMGLQYHPSGGIYAITMVDTLKGWAVGDKIIHTIDGQNWFEQENPNMQNAMTDVFFLNESEGWIIGNGGLIMHTNSGGENWIKVAEGLTNTLLRGIHFTSPTNGYIVGNNKTLLKYTQVSGIDDYLDKVDFEIFPNPSKNSSQIRCLDFNTESGTIEMLSIVGEMIFEKEINKGTEKIDIDLSDLGPGMYLCKITIDNRSSTKKIIKE